MGLNVLIIENDYLTAEGLSAAVTSLGYRVAGMVGDLDKAIELLRNHTVAGALVDINLCGHVSFPLCEELERRKVPFVFVTGYPRSVIPSRFADRTVLVKPVDPNDLKEALGTILPARSGAAESERMRLGNDLLDKLTDSTGRALEARLVRVGLVPGQRLNASRSTPYNVYFPTDGLISLLARDQHGHTFAVGMVGREGMAGAEGVLSLASATSTQPFVELQGEAWQIAIGDLRALLQDRQDLRDDLLAYIKDTIGELARTALITASGTIEHRLAYWILNAADKIGRGRVSITHERLSEILAVRRAGVTTALHKLEGLGAITSHRSLIEITDRIALGRVASGCDHGTAIGHRLTDPSGTPPSASAAQWPPR